MGEHKAFFFSPEDLSSDEDSDPTYFPQVESDPESPPSKGSSSEVESTALCEDAGQSSSPTTRTSNRTESEPEATREISETASASMSPTTEGNDGTETRNNASKKVRKRLNNKEKWVKNQIKNAVNSGNVYLNPVTKKVHGKEKEVKPFNCPHSCPFRCFEHFSETDRQIVFKNFWALSKDSKRMYYLKTTKPLPKKRNKKRETRRKHTFHYYLSVHKKTVEVCKGFYFATLDIDDKRIHYAHKLSSGGVPPVSVPQNPVNKSKEEDLAYIRKHIESFPTIESHYCRAKTNRKFLDPSLNISKMHSLYESKCAEDGKLPLKEHMYRKVFNCEFNLAFHVPKTDRCDVCEEKKVAEQNGTELSEEVKTSQAKHVKGKLESKEERDKDRASDDPVLCFDMENVFSLPKGDVSSFFFTKGRSLALT